MLPAVEDGILNDNWRIRQSSVELLGDLLFKVSVFSFVYFGCVTFFLLGLPEELLKNCDYVTFYV